MNSKGRRRLAAPGWPWLWLAIVAATAYSFAGCGVRRPTTIGGEQTPTDQWSQGVWVYGQSCAGCHGENGEGDEDSPPLVGEGSLSLDPPAGSPRTSKFRTAEDVFQYVKKKMPPIDPGGLSDKDYWAIIAYVLKQGGRYGDEGPIFEANGGKIKLR